MFMIREDGTMDEGGGAAEEEMVFADEEDDHIDSEEEEDDDIIVGSQNLCRVCGKSLEGEERNVKVGDNTLNRAFSKLYQIDVCMEPDYIPKNVHYKCFWALKQNLTKFDKKSPVAPPALAKFVKDKRKCSGCNQYNTGHNRSSCPVLAEKKLRQKKVKLMDLKRREQGNARCQEWMTFTEEFCQKSGEEEIDLLGM